MKRILVVDDEENARIALSKILSREGYDVASAGNGFEALTYLREKDVELIITDINMPEMNGMVFLRELNKAYPASSVIMITAYGDPANRLMGKLQGVAKYLIKPFTPAEVVSIIRQVLEQDPDEPAANGG